MDSCFRPAQACNILIPFGFLAVPVIECCLRRLNN